MTDRNLEEYSGLFSGQSFEVFEQRIHSQITITPDLHRITEIKKTLRLFYLVRIPDKNICH